MSIFTKTICTKNKPRYEIISKQTTTIACAIPSCPNSSVPATAYSSDHHTSIDIDPQECNILTTTSPLEPRYPVFTVAVGIFDIFMLIVVYIVQEGTAITFDTWIQMGSKYVPCMKPLNSIAEQEIYNAQLKSKCQPFLFPYQFFRFLTPIFLHSGITHLLSNLVYQALAGSLLEGKYGIRTLGLCYILFGFSGNVMSALCNPTSISVGASGAVYGLLLFCIIDNTLRIFTILNIQDKIIQFLITFLVIPYIVLSIFFDVDCSGHTDHAAHVGGAVMGILVAMFLCDMPRFITTKIPNGKNRIQLTALILIIAYFVITLFIFYIFTPVNLT